MEFNIPVGTLGKHEMIVATKNTAAHYGSGLIEVFATPSMVGLMEGTAQLSVQPYLPKGYVTLGIEINVKHLKATPVGMKVSCKSRLINVDGKKLTFEINAWDKKGEIGIATHVRYIVESSKFMEKLQNQ